MSGFFKRNAKRATQATTDKVATLVNAREIRDTATTTAELARQVFVPAKPGRMETFQHAVMRRGLSEADLAALHRQWAVLSCLFLVFMTAAAGAGVMFLLDGSVAGALASCGALLAFLGHYIKASFRAAQLEARTLFSLPFWLRRPSLWAPAWTLPPAPKAKPSRALVPHD